MKKLWIWIAVVAFALSACGSENAETPTTSEPVVERIVDDGVTTVGICLPARDDRWEKEGEALVEALDVGNYAVQLLYAEEDAQVQADQVEKLIAADVDCLVVAAVDSLSLTEGLSHAKAEGIPVIAYDRLLMQTDSVTCYVAFDMLGAGKTMAEYIVDEKQLTTAHEESRSYTIELFMGTPEDNNALFLYQGIMDVLQTYIDSGVLICLSGRLPFEDCCIPGWSAELAKEACDLRLKEHYPETVPDILCAASDSLAEGVCESMQIIGYAGEQLITGQGAQTEAIERVQAGTQSMTLQPDTQELVRQCVMAVDALLQGRQPEYNDIDSCFNGEVTVPAYLLPMELVAPEKEIPPTEESVPTTETSPQATEESKENTTPTRS